MTARRKVERRTAVRHRRRFAWESWTDAQLLELRLCDLGITLEGSWLEGPIRTVRREVEARGLRLRPSFWLSDEWFSPAGVGGVALPFFLAHPRLVRLERKQMLEVEGSTRNECLKLLRHEVGHALQHAFRLHRRRGWQRVFGSSSLPYPDYYQPNPMSRSYVLHLDYWYAQAHPDEDFAETFAVWLTPGSRWRRRYAEWPALEKLEFLDGLMVELDGRAPLERSRARVDPLPSLKQTLRAHYEAKHKRFKVLSGNVYDRDLHRLFPNGAGTSRGESAGAFLRRNRTRIRQMVARGTGRHEYALDVLIREMIQRCRELELRAVGSRRQLLLDLAILLSARSVEYLYRGRDWHAL